MFIYFRKKSCIYSFTPRNNKGNIQEIMYLWEERKKIFMFLWEKLKDEYKKKSGLNIRGKMYSFYLRVNGKTERQAANKPGDI
jgi:hypothetical protein